MTDTEIKINRPLLATINFFATVIDLTVLFYSFKQLKYQYFILGVVGILLMVITTCLEYYFCRIVFKSPRVAKVRNFFISLTLMYLGLFMFIAAASLNKSWNFKLICTVICQVLYSCISFYVLFCLKKMKPNILIEGRDELEDNRMITQNEQISGAYSPEIGDNGGVYIPPEPFFNYDIEQITNSRQSNIDHSSLNDFESSSNPAFSEYGRSLTNGLHYAISSRRTASYPIIWAYEKPDSLTNENTGLYKRSSSFLENYGVMSNSEQNSARYIEGSTTTGAISEYEMFYVQSDMLDGSQSSCNPYANVCAENII